MKLDWENIWISIKRHKRLLLIIGGLALLLIFIVGTIQSCGNWFDLRYLQKRFEGINAANANANQVNANINALNEQERNQNAFVNQAGQNFNQARNDTNGARNETDEQLKNVGNVENGNFANTNMTEAEKARCRAFPNAEGCK